MGHFLFFDDIGSFLAPKDRYRQVTGMRPSPMIEKGHPCGWPLVIPSSKNYPACAASWALA